MGDHVSGRNRDFACWGSGQHDPVDAFLLPFLRVGGSQQNGFDLPAGLSSDDFWIRWSFATGSLDPASFNQPLIRLITATTFS